MAPESRVSGLAGEATCIRAGIMRNWTQEPLSYEMDASPLSPASA
jgi:hypothetical protein